jgi:uncharacterized cupredoxin-like copper-binding protein
MGSGGFKAACVAAALAIALVPACGGDDGGGDGGGSTGQESTGADTGGGATTVDVTLQEFAVSATPASVPAGSVTFDITNDGPNDVHEFVIMRTDLPPTELPVKDDGSVDEDADTVEAVDEVEDLAVGANETLTVDLDAGSYVLVCNIVQEESDGTTESHYQEGMRTSFMVE